ncbi:TRASH domain-containing protein [Sulfuracidifex tepidarius]|nr:TRASH domain-containing protein [Sulfuracidifex tepidarius]BBG25756.1 hypothetical protein IC007_0261 [Sulfuracidifex tepidarius]
MEEKFSELEFRAIEALRRNPRISVKDLAKELNVNRNTASRILRSLFNKGVKLKVTVESFPTVFILGKCVSWCEECYPLVDGKELCVVRSNDVSSILNKAEEAQAKEVLISMKGNVKDIHVRPSLTCDYCGKEIHQGEKYFTYTRNNRTYYVCCSSCLKELKRNMERTERL